MSYFEDQEEAWFDSGCKGDITDMNPDEYWVDKISSCSHKKIREAKCNGKIVKVCANCRVVL